MSNYIVTSSNDITFMGFDKERDAKRCALELSRINRKQKGLIFTVSKVTPLFVAEYCEPCGLAKLKAVN